MHTWPVQDAKARLSEFLDACLVEGPQMVTRRGAEAAVRFRNATGSAVGCYVDLPFFLLALSKSLKNSEG